MMQQRNPEEDCARAVAYARPFVTDQAPNDVTQEEIDRTLDEISRGSEETRGICVHPALFQTALRKLEDLSEARKAREVAALKAGGKAHPRGKTVDMEFNFQCGGEIHMRPPGPNSKHGEVYQRLLRKQAEVAELLRNHPNNAGLKAEYEKIRLALDPIGERLKVLPTLRTGQSSCVSGAASPAAAPAASPAASLAASPAAAPDSPLTADNAELVVGTDHKKEAMQMQPDTQAGKEMAHAVQHGMATPAAGISHAQMAEARKNQDDRGKAVAAQAAQAQLEHMRTARLQPGHLVRMKELAATIKAGNPRILVSEGTAAELRCLAGENLTVVTVCSATATGDAVEDKDFHLEAAVRDALAPKPGGGQYSRKEKPGVHLKALQRLQEKDPNGWVVGVDSANFHMSSGKYRKVQRLQEKLGCWVVVYDRGFEEIQAAGGLAEWLKLAAASNGKKGRKRAAGYGARGGGARKK
jgi:hypothetical protein